jgi:hypothetical protein
MQFTIEVEDFWLEEEDLTEALTSKVKHEVVQGISASIKDKVEKQITEKINEVIEQKVSLIIDSTLTDLIATGMITSNRNEISIVDHVKGIFQNNTGWSRPDDQISRIAKKFGEELKLQYNNAFANKIVQNMKEQGLLKDEVVQILLGDK